MRIVSFAWTTEALLQGKKTQTRRLWKDHYAKQFKNGDLVQAYDKNPRAGGKLVAIIQLIADPFKQFPHEMSVQDFIAEGGTLHWRDRRELVNMLQEMSLGAAVWVLKFKLMKVVKHD